VDADGELVLRNRIRASADDGLVIVSDDSEFRLNVIVGSGGDGIVVLGSGNEVEDNRVEGSAEAALEVQGSANVFAGNTTDGSGEEVDDGASLDANVFVQGGITVRRR
jgi:hypothetical protein